MSLEQRDYCDSCAGDHCACGCASLPLLRRVLALLAESLRPPPLPSLAGTIALAGSEAAPTGAASARAGAPVQLWQGWQAGQWRWVCSAGMHAGPGAHHMPPPAATPTLAPRAQVRLPHVPPPNPGGVRGAARRLGAAHRALPQGKALARRAGGPRGLRASWGRDNGGGPAHATRHAPRPPARLQSSVDLHASCGSSWGSQLTKAAEAKVGWPGRAGCTRRSPTLWPPVGCCGAVGTIAQGPLRPNPPLQAPKLGGSGAAEAAAPASSVPSSPRQAQAA